jgi:hypothetical protein
MSEDVFAETLVCQVRDHLAPRQIARKLSLLYDLAINDRGGVELGIDADSGEPIRGKGRGFEQDILVYDGVEGLTTTVVPRVSVEVKFQRVTTHDILVYAEKADRIKRIYPYVRYGLLLGGMRHIPGRALRLGHRFDFIIVTAEEPEPPELRALADLLRTEAETSVAIADYLYRKAKPRWVHRKLLIQ